MVNTQADSSASGYREELHQKITQRNHDDKAASTSPIAPMQKQHVQPMLMHITRVISSQHAQADIQVDPQTTHYGQDHQPTQ
uniref:Uncharacterized protein n=1 Tax=Panagrolaimus sp. ES5 TaxID=591445 RepID=A0AC34GFR2_9BILA